MNKELIDAVKERIELGHSKAEIARELRGAGYGEDAIDATYNRAKGKDFDKDEGDFEEGPVSLPPLGNLLADSFSYAWRRFSLTGWTLLLGFVAIVLIGLGAVLMTVSMVAGVLVIVVAVLAIILLSFALGLAIQYIAVTDSETKTVPFRDGFRWAREHLFWSGMWVVVLFVLITQGASALLLIPYIVIGPFISFMMLAYITEDFKGMTSVFRARELGRGNWKSLVVRKVGFWLVGIVPIVVLVAVIYSMFAPIYMEGGEAAVESWFDTAGSALYLVFGIVLLGIVYGIFINIAGWRLNALLFKRLVAARPVTPLSGEGKDQWKYIVLAVVGLISLVIPPEETDNSWEVLDEEAQVEERERQEEAKEKAQDLRDDIEAARLEGNE